MPRKRYNAEAIIHKLREADVLIGQGKTVHEVCKALGVTDQNSFVPVVTTPATDRAPAPRLRRKIGRLQTPDCACGLSVANIRLSLRDAFSRDGLREFRVASIGGADLRPPLQSGYRHARIS
jgi:hypothetical protein